MQENKTPNRTLVFGISSLWTGGAQLQLSKQLPYYVKHGYSVHVISLLPNTGSGNVTHMMAAYAHIHQFSFRGFVDVKNWYRLFCTLKNIKPDLVISSLFFANTVFRVLKLLLGYPVISREHNTYTERKKTHRIVDRYLSRFSETIVAVSQEVAEYESAQSLIPLEKFTVIHNGIDLGNIETYERNIKRTEVRKRLGYSDQNLVFIYVGRLVRQKNVDVIVKGFALHYVTSPDARLLLVGDGGLRKKLQDIIHSLDIQDTVTFIGNTENPHTYYRAADIFVSASNREGMSNTQLEALAHGLPLLTTKTGGTSALLRDRVNGFLIETATPESVAGSMRKVSETNRSALKIEAKKHAQRFDILKTVARYEQLFDKTITQR